MPRDRLELLAVHGSRGWGGMEMHPVAQAAGLAARGHGVRAAVAPDSRLARAFAEAGVETIALRGAGAHDPRSLAALARAVRRRAPDLVVVHRPKDLWGALAVARRAPVVLHRHSAGAGAPRRDPLHRWAAARLRLTVAVSDYVAATARRLYDLPAARVLVVPYGIEAPVVSSEDVARAREELRRARPAVARWVAVVAQLSRGKRQDLALDALARLGGGRGDVGVTFVGAEASRGWRAELEARARALGLADRVFFCGHRDDAGAWMRAAEVLALPTDAESFGLVLLEAMSLGVPVVASSGGGVPEVVEDGKSGLLHAPGDAESMARAIARVLDDRALATDLARAGRARFEARFALARELEDLERLYRAVAAGTAP